MIDGRKILVDPNRDFPYFNNDSDVSIECMQSATARTINELFREHIFVTTITLHGGLNAIGYPWGNFVHNNDKESPDSYSAKSKLV
jgi:hypothetical protein